MSKHVTLRDPKTGILKVVPRAGGPKVFMDGNEGWEVLGEHEGAQPEHSTWQEGKGWVVDEDLVKREAERIRLETLTRLEFMAEVNAKLALLDERLKALERSNVT